MKPRVYLAGPITGETYKSSTGWRDYAAQQLAEWGIQAASPMRGKGYLDNGEPINAFNEQAPLSTIRGIVTRDHFDVKQADVILMNLGGARRVSIGTMVEVGWASAYGKPIVLVAEAGNIHEHPFLEGLAGYHVADLDSGLRIVRAILEPYVNPEEAYPIHKLEFQGNEIHY